MLLCSPFDTYVGNIWPSLKHVVRVAENSKERLTIFFEKLTDLRELKKIAEKMDKYIIFDVLCGCLRMIETNFFEIEKKIL